MSQRSPGNLAAAAWFGSSKVCAIMGGCDTQTLAEHDAHPVCRAEAAVIGDGFERPVATLQQHAGGVDTGPLDEFVRRDSCLADKMSGEVARAHPNTSASDMILDACDRRGRISRRGEIWAEIAIDVVYIGG